MIDKNDKQNSIKKKRNKLSTGGRNLVFLGVISVLVAISTTSVSLAIYHNSGDIYLDRSRPGYLPDEDEIEDEDNKSKEYEFSKNGKINLEVLDEYLENLNKEIQAIDAYGTPFGPEILSDDRLGISTGETEP